jgi:hypothetical protein
VLVSILRLSICKFGWPPLQFRAAVLNSIRMMASWLCNQASRTLAEPVHRNKGETVKRNVITSLVILFE